MASRSAAGGRDDEEEDVEFTECAFCGMSSEGDDDGDFKFDSAFARSIGQSKVSGREHRRMVPSHGGRGRTRLGGGAHWRTRSTHARGHHINGAAQSPRVGGGAESRPSSRGRRSIRGRTRSGRCCRRWSAGPRCRTRTGGASAARAYPRPGAGGPHSCTRTGTLRGALRARWY